MINAVCAKLPCWRVLHDRSPLRRGETTNISSCTAMGDDFIAAARLNDSKILQLFVFPNSRSNTALLGLWWGEHFAVCMSSSLSCPLESVARSTYHSHPAPDQLQRHIVHVRAHECGAYERCCDSALRWVRGTDGSIGEEAFRRMNVNCVAFLGDYARLAPTA
jgi:hypothetical protein